MLFEIEIILGIKKLIDGSNNSVDCDSVIIYKSSNPNRYELRFKNKSFSQDNFRFLHLESVSESSEVVSFPSDEECLSLSSTLDPESYREYQSLREMGNSILTKIGLGLLIIQ